jgi:hypothetical protein
LDAAGSRSKSRQWRLRQMINNFHLYWLCSISSYGDGACTYRPNDNSCWLAIGDFTLENVLADGYLIPVFDQIADLLILLIDRASLAMNDTYDSRIITFLWITSPKMILSLITN